MPDDGVGLLRAMDLVRSIPRGWDAKRRRRLWEHGEGLIYGAVGLVLPLLAWELLVRGMGIPEYVLPAPSAIFVKAIEPGRAAFLLPQALYTAGIVLAGFFAACAAALLLAIGSLYSRPLELSLMPILVGSQVVPKVAFAPLIVIWFGIGLASKLVMVVIISFFPVVLASLVGFRSVSPDSIRVVRSMGGSRLQELTKVRIPAALPQMFAGFKVAMTLSMIGAIVAEFVAANVGLGHVLIIDQASMETALVFTDLLWLIVVGFILYGAVGLAERLMLGRRAKIMTRSGHQG